MAASAHGSDDANAATANAATANALEPLSALATHIQAALARRAPPGPQTTAQHALALQVQHNLQWQHQWAALRLHTHSPLAPHAPLTRPLVSGLPPRRLYVHPDEQIERLTEQARRRPCAGIVAGVGGDNDNDDGDDDEPATEREWVLPTRLREAWSLRRLADVFDSIGEVPPEADREDDGGGERRGGWRCTKRVVMAIVGDDGTVVYYIVHDGLVKPRQN